MGARQSSPSTPVGEIPAEWLPSSSCTRHLQAAKSDDTCIVKIAANAHFDINYRPTFQTLFSDKDTILYQGFSYDCQGKQLPAGIFYILKKSSTTLKSLTLNNLPNDCRVCIYDLFRKLQLDQYEQLEQLILTRMYKDECYIKLADGLTLPFNVTHLTLCGIGLVTVPLAISTLKSLTHLSLANNIITHINSLVEDKSNALSTLVYLDVAENLLTAIPTDIDKLANLKVLNVGHNCIKKTMPDSIGNLQSLTELLFQWNRLEDLSMDIITQLNSLKVLDISHNKLKKISKKLFFHSSLTLLNMSGNVGLTFCNCSDTKLERSLLEELDISSMSLCFLPSFIADLHELTVLNCEDNNLSSIDIILTVKSLKRANFRSNCIIDCTKVINFLQATSTTKLTFLDLVDNGLTTETNNDSIHIKDTVILLHASHDIHHQYIAPRRASNKASSEHKRVQWLCCTA